MDDICIMLAKKLMVNDSNEIKKELASLFKYNYHRIYHLSTISDDLYYKLLSKTPKSLTTELYAIMSEIRTRYKYAHFPFHNYSVKKSNEINIDWTMTTRNAFELLE
eukprot:250379_1